MMTHPVQADAATAVGDEWTLLVEATRRMLTRDDAPALTIQAILDEAGLSTRSLYRHFQSKDDLIAAVLRIDARTVETRLLRSMAVADGPRACVVAWLDAWLTVALVPANLQRLRAVAQHLDPQVADALSSASQRLGHLSRALLASALERGLACGEFPLAAPLDDASAAHAVISDLIGAFADGNLPQADDARQRMLFFLSRLLGTDLTR